MIVDIYLPTGLISENCERLLVQKLMDSAARAIGVQQPPSQEVLESTGVYIHHMPKSSIYHGTNEWDSLIRIQVIVTPQSIDRSGLKRLVANLTEAMVQVSNDASLVNRTVVIVIESAAGGFGFGGQVFRKKKTNLPPTGS